MNSDQYSDIKVVNIYTEKELTAEFDTFFTLLQDTNGDWNKRLNAIKKLEGIILGGGAQLNNFPMLMSKLYPHMTAQINDLRSAITKEAGRMVVLAAQQCGQKLDVFCERIISKEFLLKVISSANKIISENGHDAVLNLIEYVQNTKIIPKIVDEFTNKNQAVRNRVAAYLQKVLEVYSVGMLEKYASIIETGINTTIADANKDTRQIIRNAFKLYSQKFPARAEKMIAKFDLSVQKALIEEGTLNSDGYLSKNRGSLQNTMQETKPLNRTVKTKSATIAVDTKMQESKKMAESLPLNYDDDVSTDLSSGNSVKQRPTSSTKPPVKNAPERSVKRPLTTVPTKSNDVKGLYYNADAMEIEEPVIPLRKSDVTFNKKNTTAEALANESYGLSKKMVASKPKQEPKVIETYDIIEETEATETNYYLQAREDDLTFLLEKANDENWATRYNSFDKIAEFITEWKPSEQLNSSLIDMLITSHIQHLTDPHVKVIGACIGLLTKLITLFPEKILVHIDRVIPPVVISLSENKEKLYNSANFLLNLIIKLYQSDDLVPVLLRALELNSKPKYKISILEIINMLIQETTKYFDSTNNLRIFINRIAVMINENSANKQILLPCVGILLSVRDKNCSQTMYQILNLPSHQLNNVRTIMSQFAPDFDANLKSYLTKENQKHGSHSIASKENKNINTKKPILEEIVNTQTKGSKILKPDNMKLKQIVTDPSPTTYHNENSSPTNNRASSSNNRSQESEKEQGSEDEEEMPTKNRELNQYLQDEEKEQEEDDDYEQQQQDEEEQDEEAPQDNNARKMAEIENLINDFPRTKKTVENKLEDIIYLLLVQASSSNDDIEKSLQLISKLMDLPLNFGIYIDQLISGLITLYHLPTNEKDLIDEVLSKIVDMGYPEQCLRSLIENMDKEDHPIVETLVKYISNVFNKNSVSKTRPLLPLFIDRIKSIFTHPNPEVRKAIVFCLVDLNFIFSEFSSEYLNDFNASQQKLVSIYIQRRVEKGDLPATS
jgi:CLIP-associating protein 1/2